MRCAISEYICCELEIEDADTIKETLKELGFPYEEHKEGTNLVGWLGDKRSQLAHIVVRRRNISRASNDIGFRKTESGKYELIISEYDRNIKKGKIFLTKFKQVYAVKQAKKYLKRKGYKLKKQKVEKDGTIELRFV